MATVQECGFRFFETKSVIKTQSRYRTQYLQIMLPGVGLGNFKRLVVFCAQKGVGRPSTSQEDVDGIQEAWISYVPRRARILKLFSIVQHLLYKQ
jgi:hypothetical protein